jgi:serine/threonine protein kinase
MTSPQSSSLNIRHLTAVHRGHGGDFEHLLDYEGFRYHLLLQFNAVEPASPENLPLETLYNAMSGDDDNEIEAAADKCLNFLWPFMEDDFASRSGSTAPTNEVIKLQVLPVAGVLRTVNHEKSLEYPPTKPVDNTFSDVPVFPSSEIERLAEPKMHIFKVRLPDHSISCLKTVHRTGNTENFIREVSILRRCSHSNIVPLVGVMVDGDGRVEGMIIDWVENARLLRDLKSISAEECERWTRQIRDAIMYLHENELIWGDVKAANVLIDMSGNAVLIDFGGGYTDGWVDVKYQHTVDGDLQGLERIISFMRSRLV